METLGGVLIGIGFFGFLVSLVILIVALIKKERKKVWILSLLLFFILACLGGSMLPESDKTSKTTVVEQKKTQSEEVLEVRICPSDGINIRVGPGTTYEKDPVGPLKKGQKIHIVEDRGGWVRFKFADSDTEWSGWVKKSLVITKEEKGDAQKKKEQQKKKEIEPTSDEYSEYSIGWKLCVIDGDYEGEDSVKVRRYNYLLEALAKKCSCDGINIADMTCMAQKVLREKYGREVKTITLLEAANKDLAYGCSKDDFAKYMVIVMQVLK